MYYHIEAVRSYLIPLLIRCLLFTLEYPCKLAVCYLSSLSSDGVGGRASSHRQRENSQIYVHQQALKREEKAKDIRMEAKWKQKEIAREEEKIEGES